ncbi:MAG: VOC family protein [Alphaproteobacteria bacterium]|nr:VOC family protein [Alphaproteobacteria bacterium]MCY4318539.1 VOC family protein [Alphaproteobacteria bacterium]
MALAWSHIVLYVEDKERMLAFYTDMLGFEVTDRGPVRLNDDREIVFLSQDPEEHHQIALLDGRTESGPSNSVNHAAFRIDNLAALRKISVALEAEGISYNPRTHGNSWSIYFEDPERNGIEIFCNTPWKVAQPQTVAWDPALSDDELVLWTEQRFRDEPGFAPTDA